MKLLWSLITIQISKVNIHKNIFCILNYFPNKIFFAEPSPREESVCLTPACQEGKDLQVPTAGLKTANENLLQPEASGKKSEDMESQIDGNDFSSQNNDTSPAEQTTSDKEYKNGCPSS